MSDIGRWGALDPMAELGYDISTYNYSFNNPIKYFDIAGLWSVSVVDGNLVFQREEGDNAQSLATQLGVSEEDAQALLDAEDGENGQYSFSSLDVVSNINSFLKGDHNGKNCVNACLSSNGQDSQTASEDGGISSMSQLESQLPNAENVSVSDSRIGDIISYIPSFDNQFLTWLSAGAQDLPEYRNADGSLKSKEEMRPILKALYDQYLQENVIVFQHFSVIILKDDSGQNVQSIFEKQGLIDDPQINSSGNSELFTPSGRNYGTSPIFRLKR